ncbi:MAG: YqaE/Pmp3 family membrane protein [Sediminibacterium sp.]
MKRNWIVFAFALLALASCSVEKRVYQPGYHIEWNHFAKQDAERDAAQDVAQDVSQGRSEGVSQGRSEGASQDLSENLLENLETDVSQDSVQSIDSDLEFVLLIILALFLPALTVFLLEGFSKNFWIALLLMAVAYLLPISSFIVRGLIVAIATILAIAVVFHYM